MSGAGVRLLQTKPLNTVDTKFIQALVKFEEQVEGVYSILTGARSIVKHIFKNYKIKKIITVILILQYQYKL